MGEDLVDLVDVVVVGEKYVAGPVLVEEVMVLEGKDGHWLIFLQSTDQRIWMKKVEFSRAETAYVYNNHDDEQYRIHHIWHVRLLANKMTGNCKMTFNRFSIKK